MDESTESNETKSQVVVYDVTNKKPKNDSWKKKKKSRYFESAGEQSAEKKHFNIDKDKKGLKIKKFKDKKKKMDSDSKKDGDEIERKSLRDGVDPFPGDKPVPNEKLKKYTRGHRLKVKAKTPFHAKVLKKKREKEESAAKQAARLELLQVEESGFLEAEEGENTADITQHDLVNSVDIASATKYFDLNLKDFGPYRIDYTRNGRFLLLGGRKGHIAAIDWMTKKLLCEINVMEKTTDIQWLHQETMFAVSQKKWTYIYDNQGIELHCLKMLHDVQRMEFLPYHFLLAAANGNGFLQYVDVSIGEIAGKYNTHMGRLDVMCQNPSNAVIALGHSGGVVTMWTPTIKEPVIKMLTHRSGVRAIDIERTGNYLATSGLDGYMKMWDLRTYKMLQSYRVKAGPGTLSFSQRGLLAAATENIVESYRVKAGPGTLNFSQRGLLAAGTENIVEVYKDCCKTTASSPYMVHKVGDTVQNLQFCPFEDVLGIGHSNGFQSILIPGAGEANFDALEVNPYQSKNHRRQAEVKMLLEKIPAELIHPDTNVISKVNQKSIKEKMEEKAKLMMGKVDKTTFQPKFKTRGKSKGDNMIKRQKKVEESHKREQFKQKIVDKQTADREKKIEEKRQAGPTSVLDRFKKKDD